MRQCNNAFVAIFRRKDYVVVHLRKTGNRTPQVHFIIPNAQDNFNTKVPLLFSNRRYTLRPDEFNYTEGEINKNSRDPNRKHYILNEEDAMVKKFRIVPITNEDIVYTHKGRIFFSSDEKAIPIKLDKRTDEDYIIASKRMNGAMSAKSYRIIHEEQKQTTFIIALVAGLIIVAVAIYGVMQYQQLAPLVQTIYQQTVIQHGQTVIIPAPTPTP